MSITCRHATVLDAYALSEVLRPEDYAEVAVARPGVAPLDSLREGILRSQNVWTITRSGDGQMVGIFGASPDPQAVGRGRVWFLAAEGVERHGLSVTKLLRTALKQGESLFPKGYLALAWEGNLSHLRWLPLVGFHPANLPPHMVGSERFLWYIRNV